MNRSFSKIRHIQEVNRLLEQRLSKEQGGGGAGQVGFDPKNPQTLITDEKNKNWDKYRCVYNRSDKQETKFGDETTPSVFTVGDFTYYVDGSLTFTFRTTETAGKYNCDGSKINIYQYPIAKTKTTETNTPDKAGLPPKRGNYMKFQHCYVVNGLYKSCYNEKHVKRLQSCLGLTGKNVDGYFGGKTETILVQKFPEYKDKKILKTDIDKICNEIAPRQTGAPGQYVQKPDEVGNEPGSGVLLPQDQRPIPTTPITPVQSTTKPAELPTPQIDIKTQATAIQQKITDLKKQNPGITNDEIAVILKQEGIVIPKTT